MTKKQDMETVEKYFYINIKDFFTKKDVFENGETELMEYISDYKCPLNADVEHFLKNNAIDFSNKKQSVTYLVFTLENITFVGYFTLALKPLEILPDSVSKSMEKKIKRIAIPTRDNSYLLSAYLIAQLGKNYNNGANKKITGDELVALAIGAVREFIYGLGGLVVYLEAEPTDKLLQFYQNESNKFRVFDTIKSNSKEKDMIRLIKLL